MQITLPCCIPWKRPAQSGRKRYDSQASLKLSLSPFIRLAMVKQGFKLTDKPLKIQMTFHFHAPKKMFKMFTLDKPVHCLKHIDVDNLAKFYLDLMNQIVYLDDSQVVDLHVQKFYTPKDDYTEIFITELSND